MRSFSRRGFLTTSSLAVAGLGFSRPRIAQASSIVLPMRSKAPVAAFLPDLVDPETLRQLARTGVEAAQHAGADYADVRVADVRKLRTDWSMPQMMPLPYSDLHLEYGFGVRVRVGGAWGFAFDVDPTPDGIARAAQSAVNTARGLAKMAGPAVTLIPAPALKGEWSTTVDVDPFSVAPDTHMKLLGACIDAAERVRDGTVGELVFRWAKETRVFASSDGALLTQRFIRSFPGIEVAVHNELRRGLIQLPVPGLAPRCAGFESVVGPELQDRIKATTEEAQQLIHYPEGEAEVGRYEAVLDGDAMAAIFGATVVQALDFERVLGYEANAAGTSFLGPVDDIIGQPVFSPHLTVTANRDASSYGAARWDDEGVATEAFPVIEQGRVVDYFTSRETAPVLAAWYAKTGRPPRSRGSAVAWSATTTPSGCASNLTVSPGKSGTGLNELVAQMSNGILARGVSQYEIGVDPQLSGGAYTARMMFEVRKGQITRRLLDGVVQFRTKSVWKDIIALGDTHSMHCHAHVDWRGETMAKVVQPVTAPAARLAQLDMIQIGRSA